MTSKGFHYPLAFTTLACPDWSWEQTVQKAVEYGYQTLEKLARHVEALRA